MKKFFCSLLMLLMGLNAAMYAQQEEATTVTAWDGSNKSITLGRGGKQTYAYTATQKGRLYIYADNQDVNDKAPVTIWGGWYSCGEYVADSPLQEAGTYENGVGVYGWINVFESDTIRFTLSVSAEAEGQLARFTLKSVFFDENVGGDSWERPIVLTKDKSVNIPVWPNNSPDMLVDLDLSNATFCKFTAPNDGVASIVTNQYLIYYLEEEHLGSVDHRFKSVPQDVANDNHEFIVTKGVDYIVVVPNIRPAILKLAMTQEGLGHSAQFAKPINAFPASIDLKKGDNYYAFSHEFIRNTNILEVAAAKGWKGSITYMEDPTEESTELSADKVDGTAATTFTKNVDTRYLSGDKVIINFKMTDKASYSKAVTLTLREPAAGESFSTAIAASLGDNAISGPAGDHWYAYTAEKDAEYSFATSGTLKHVNYTPGVEQKVAENRYRIDEGQTVYLCVATTEPDATLTITSTDIVDGDYCDRPIYFELGDDIHIKGRGIDNFHAFTAKEDGFALFHSTNWTVQFRSECGGARLNPHMTFEDGNDVRYAYKLPVSAGESYIVEVTAVSEDITITTGFEAAVAGDVCATAVAIDLSADTIDIAYEFGKAKWYKVTADKAGFLVVNAKLGYAANMTTKLGDCDAEEINAASDNSKSNAYMGGYKVAKVYVEEGQTLYIYTKTGSENDETTFSPDFYLVVSYVEARPGEDKAIAIEATPDTEYTVMTNDAEGYEQWYTYTIPAGEQATITMAATVKYISNSLVFYKEDKVNYLKRDTDYTQDNITDASGTVIGKQFVFAKLDTDRTFYIKVSTANAMYYPIVWKIELGDDVENAISAPEASDEAPAIYDLMGRRVAHPTKGIYIIDGVKRVIR